MLSAFLNHTVKETSASSTVIISFDNYHENSLKPWTREMRNGYHFNAEYVVPESTDISYASIHPTNKQNKD